MADDQAPDQNGAMRGFTQPKRSVYHSPTEVEDAAADATVGPSGQGKARARQDMLRAASEGPPVTVTDPAGDHFAP